MKKIMMLTLAAALIVPSSAFAATEPASGASAVQLNKSEAEKFGDQFFSEQDVKDQMAGALLVVVKDGQVILNKGYGYADIAAKKPVDAEKTAFRIASVSKLFTAVGIMQLSEAGKVDLDKDVQAYLPDVTIPNKTGYPLTLKNLMTHTTGFDYGDTVDSGQSYTLQKFIQEKMPTVVSKPGEAFRYDNFGFSLQGYIIEKVSGIPFDEYMKKKLFQPLGMGSSSFLLTDEVKRAIATPYDKQLQPVEQEANFPDNAPEGGMFTTGTDMAKFMLAMLNNGQGASERILTEASVKAMEKKTVTTHPDVPGVGYAFESNYPKDYNGYNVIEKAGDLSSFHSDLWLLPEQNTGLFLVFNSDKADMREPLFKQFMNRFYPKQGDGPSFVKPEPTKQQLHRFEGMYRDLRTPAWTFEITAEDGSLTIEEPLGKHTLHQAADYLFYDDEGTPAGFKADEDGTIQFLSYNKSDSWAEKLPEPPMFQDVPADHPYANYIYKVVQLGAIKSGASTFGPDKPITRGQFIAQLIPLAGFQLSSQSSAFKDVKGSLYEKEIQTAVEAGVVQGFPGSTFGPDQPLTREQAATFVWRLVHFGLQALPVEAELQGPVSPWASVGVQYVVGRQLYGPDVPSSSGPVDYRPQDPMLNQEAAVLVYQLIKKLL